MNGLAYYRQRISDVLRRIYHWAPLPDRWKSRLKIFYNQRLRGWVKGTPRSSAAVANTFPLVRADLRQYVNSLFAGCGQASDLDEIPAQAGFVREPGDVRMIAFYLPQYHPIPENDEWWGRGFTDWNNVAKALPLFCGHYQPHLPGELGFYDLRLLEVQARQIELARQFGLYGFCYYYYWFNGHRLLERPLQQLLENPELDFPFCICWANENWSRRWDGMNQDILIKQHYSDADDQDFIAGLLPVLRDSRYIRVNGRPLVLVYRPALLPDARATTRHWREECRGAGVGELYLVAVKGLDFLEPEEFGFDAAAEFPPHTVSCPDVTLKVEPVDPKFSGTVYDFASYIRAKEYLPFTPGKVFRGVMPSWDNTSRKKSKGTIFYGSTPALYEQWLTDAACDTVRRFQSEERLLFINAWNEWAEGAHLEPDRRYGYAWLNATARSLRTARESATRKKILLVGHDAHPHGAQRLLLHIMKALVDHFHYEVHLALKSGGRMIGEYAAYGAVYDLEREYDSPELRQALFASLKGQGVDIALTNTVVTGDLTPELRSCGFRTVSLVHELPGIIASYGIQPNAEALAAHADAVVFPACYVADRFATVAAVPAERRIIRPQGLFDMAAVQLDRGAAAVRLRQRLGWPDAAKVMLSVAFGDHRKGVDLFFDVARNLLTTDADCYFLWVGDIEATMRPVVEEKLRDATLRSHVAMLPFQNDLGEFYAGADIFVLTSREDPFPCVVQEAMAAGTPVVGFAGAGGFADLLAPDDLGALAPLEDTAAMAAIVRSWLHDPAGLADRGRRAAELIRRKHGFLDYIYDLLALLGHPYAKISAVIPNYNYEQYLATRLDNIRRQTYPVYEMIILDDASTDNSRTVIDEFVRTWPLLARKIYRATNSGSVFAQWDAGLRQAGGDYIWIAEADDLADTDFLATAVTGFRDPGVILSYTQSRQMDAAGAIMAPDYLDYTRDVDPDRWRSDYRATGTEEITGALSIKNTIPNVSAVLFKKVSLTELLPELLTYRCAGDWLFYVWLLQQGDIAFRATPKNNHRRHSGSVVHQDRRAGLAQEICRMQDYVAERFAVPETIRAKAAAYRDECLRILNGKEA